MPFTPILSNDSLVSTPRSTAALPFTEDNLKSYTAEVAGVKGIPPTPTLANNSWISAIVILCLLLIAYSFRYSSKYIQRILAEAFAIKDRNRRFQRSNVGVVRLKLTMLFFTFILEGLSLYIIFSKYTHHIYTDERVLPLWGLFSLGVLLFYLLQYILYQLIGYVFASRGSTAAWIASFSSITALRSVALTIPVLLAIYHNLTLTAFIYIVCGLYLVTRLLFMSKGLKIFFNGFSSLFYLILYLCTLEIAPLFVIYKGLFLLFSFVELKLF
ncbi:MAG: DUF4271 domain-containing protein [Bacteroidales bacterium]